MSDLLDRLRNGQPEERQYHREARIVLFGLLNEAAMEIERLREALKEAADELDEYYKAEYPLDHPHHVRKRENAMKGNPARCALEEKS